MARKTYFVYVVASRTRVLYVGMTSNLHRRLFEHRTGARPGLSARYGTTRLVYYEAHNTERSAVSRSQMMRRWDRRAKVTLIESLNPGWTDFAKRWYTAPALTAAAEENQRPDS